MVYKVSAIAASLGVTSLAVAAVWLRFHWHMEAGGEFPWAEAAATLLLTIGGAVSRSPCPDTLSYPPVIGTLGPPRGDGCVLHCRLPQHLCSRGLMGLGRLPEHI